MEIENGSAVRRISSDPSAHDRTHMSDWTEAAAAPMISTDGEGTGCVPSSASSSRSTCSFGSDALVTTATGVVRARPPRINRSRFRTDKGFLAYTAELTVDDLLESPYFLIEALAAGVQVLTCANKKLNRTTRRSPLDQRQQG